MSPLWVLVVSLAGSAAAGYLAWAFHVGRAPYAGKRRVGGVGRLAIVNLGYVMLPGFACMLAMALLTAFLVTDPEKTAVNKVIAIAAFVVIAASGGWAVKELASPSRSRTPDWLRRER